MFHDAVKSDEICTWLPEVFPDELIFLQYFWVCWSNECKKPPHVDLVCLIESVCNCFSLILFYFPQHFSKVVYLFPILLFMDKNILRDAEIINYNIDLGLALCQRRRKELGGNSQ